MKIVQIMLLATIALAVSSCSSVIANYTIVSTKNVEISRVDLKKIPLQKGVKGTDSRFWFLFFPFGGSPTVENAMFDCLEEGNGDFMTSCRVKDVGWTFLLFSYGGYSVKGDVHDALGSGGADLGSTSP